ncbi:MAG: hypothetical protein Q3995_07530 [Eubacteriales bacterium]|nr:hypothetical protein [Eubacteriales bacterium]
MKRYIRSFLSLCLVLVFALTAIPNVSAIADPFFVVGYTTQKSIKKDDKVSIKVTLMRTDGEADDITVVRNVDDFKGGTESVKVSCVGGKYTVPIADLQYRGEGNTLSFTVNYDGQYQNLSVKIAECVPYVEPVEDPEVPEAGPAPKVIIGARTLSKPVAANETAVITVEVANVGKTDIRSAMITFTPSDSLMLLGAQDTFYLGDIRANRSANINLTVTATKKISSQNQSIEAELAFDYDNNVAIVSGTARGRVSVPAETGSDNSDVANPVPLIILTGYSYGGSSVAAGSDVLLDFTFLNTSKTTAIENVMLKVSSGVDLTLSGSTNTFYFDRVGAGSARNVTVPFKAAQRISSNTQDVNLSFSYEYVDREQRASNTSELSISIPLYQPDRFEISDPVIPYTGSVGEEISVTLDYVNKGKSEVSNVEAEISGDVDAYNPHLRVGNLESGKSGTIAFAVTPMLEGDNQITVKVTYEDANGNVKERVFETTVTTMAFEPFDPGEWEDPIGPVDEGNGFPWWIVGIVLAAATIVIGIIVSKKKKKAKLAKEQALWDDWDDEMNTEKKTEAEAQPETAGAGTEGTDK